MRWQRQTRVVRLIERTCLISQHYKKKTSRNELWQFEIHDNQIMRSSNQIHVSDPRFLLKLKALPKKSYKTNRERNRLYYSRFVRIPRKKVNRFVKHSTHNMTLKWFDFFIVGSRPFKCFCTFLDPDWLNLVRVYWSCFYRWKSIILISWIWTGKLLISVIKSSRSKKVYFSSLSRDSHLPTGWLMGY